MTRFDGQDRCGGSGYLINPGRPIPNRPWISPGLTNDVLPSAPTLAAAEPGLAARLDGAVLVGHNVRVDWRLLHQRCPSITPAALLDTYKLARHVMTGTGYSLTTLLAALDLTAAVPNGQPHRAMGHRRHCSAARRPCSGRLANRSSHDGSGGCGEHPVGQRGRCPLRRRRSTVALLSRHRRLCAAASSASDRG
ncbi:hypothetical protein GCM10009827_114800 [Dactylosporangium maewongense]|uniref:Exonuclease domain-containing protein n=1 Tax=Dactylosporangium maewongense TaxID=634393 RepID=A0ABN2DB38_9ACTN